MARAKASKPAPPAKRNVRNIEGKSPSQVRFLTLAIDPNAPYREVVFNSDMGGGKSYMGCAALHANALRSPGSTNIVLRTTFKACRETTMETMRKWVLGPEIFAHLYKHDVHTLIYPNGSQIIFGGLDDPSSYMSAEYGLAFLDEIVPGLAGGRGISEGEWEMINLRCRDKASKVHRILGATNAGSPTHWLLRREGESRLHMVKAAPGENDAQLGAEYRSVKESLTGAWRDRYLLNKWVSHEGAVFSELDTRKHVRTDIDPPNGARVSFGVDFGFNHKFCCLFAWRHNDEWYVFDEVSGGRADGMSRTTEEWAKEINIRWPDRIFTVAYADHDPTDHITLKKYAPRISRVVNAEKKDERAGVMLIKTLLAKGKLYIHPRCKGLIAEMESLSWRVTRGGEVLDVPEDEENDCCDALRYLVASTHVVTRAREEAPIAAVPVLAGARSIFYDDDPYAKPSGETYRFKGW